MTKNGVGMTGSGVGMMRNGGSKLDGLERRGARIGALMLDRVATAFGAARRGDAVIVRAARDDARLRWLRRLFR